MFFPQCFFNSYFTCYNLLSFIKASSPWAAEAELWPKTDRLYVIEDQQCEELHSLITADHLAPDIKLQQRQALINLLENNWDTGYVSYTHTHTKSPELLLTHCSFSYKILITLPPEDLVFKDLSVRQLPQILLICG